MKTVMIIAALSILMMLTSILPLVQGQPVSTIRGPRFDLLRFLLQGSQASEIAAFGAGGIDLVNWPLTATDVGTYTGSPTVTLDPYTGFDMFEFDVNNNETIAAYPGYPSPTHDPEFRKAIQYFVNRPTYVTTNLGGLANPMYTIGWVNNPTFLNTSAYLPGNSPAAGVAALDAAGYTINVASGNRINPLTGMDLEPLIFYIRSDDPIRMAVGTAYATVLTAVGIPVTSFVVPWAVVRVKVLFDKDFNLYTGCWSLSEDMDWTFDLFHSSNYWHPGKPPNYNNINDPILDKYLEDVKFATTIPQAQEALKNAQGRWQQIMPMFPLWQTNGYLAHQNTLVNTVNEQGAGTFSSWTFYGSHMTGSYNGGTLNSGLLGDSYMNPLYSGETFHENWNPLKNSILGQIYDSLISQNPYTLSDQPWMARSWETGTWFNGTDTLTMFTFHLRPGMKWHDGEPVTSADVKFTYEYVKNYAVDSWLFPRVKFIDHVTTPDPQTVVVYMNTASVWALHNIQIYMLPQHIWAGIADPHGFSPDADLVGSGPWIGDARAPGEGGNPGPEGYIVGSLAILRANRNYYLYNHPKPDVNWDGLVDIYDIITVAVAFGATPVDPNWDIKADITADWYLIDIYDLILVAVWFGLVWGP